MAKSRRSSRKLLWSAVVVIVLAIFLAALLVSLRHFITSPLTTTFVHVSPTHQPMTSYQTIYISIGPIRKVGEHTPVQFVVTDPKGFQTGYQSKSYISINDIPNSSYGLQGGEADLPGELIFQQNDPEYGTYRVDVYGFENWSYSLDLSGWAGKGPGIHKTINATAVKGTTDTYEFTISRNSLDFDLRKHLDK